MGNQTQTSYSISLTKVLACLGLLFCSNGQSQAQYYYK